MAVVRELITKLGFQVDEKPLAKAETAVERLKGAIEVLLAALAIEKVYEFFAAFGEKSEELEKASQRLGITTESVQKLKYAAEQSGVEFSTLSRGLNILSKNLVGAEDGTNKTAEALASLGIDPKKFKNSEEALLALADKFKGMDDGIKKTALAMQLFGRSGANEITFLNQGAEGIRQMMDEAEALNIVVGKEGVEGAVKFEHGLKKIQAFLTGIGDQIAAKAVPYLNDLIKGFVEWAKANREVIESGIEKFAKALGFIFVTLGKVIAMVVDILKGANKLILAIGKSLFGSDDAAKKFRTAILGLAAAFLVLESPILLVIAAIGGIALIYDDVKAYIEGRPSLFKPVYDALLPVIHAIRDAWNKTVEFLDNLALVLEDTFGPVWDQIKEWITEAFHNEAVQYFIESLKIIWDWLTKIEQKLESTALGKFLSPSNNIFLKGTENLIDAVNRRGGEIKERRARGEGYLGPTVSAERIQTSERQGAPVTPVQAPAIAEGLKNILQNFSGMKATNALHAIGLPQGKPSQNNNITLHSSVQVTVDGSQDANSTATKIGDLFRTELGNMLRSTTRATQSGAVN